MSRVPFTLGQGRRTYGARATRRHATGGTPQVPIKQGFKGYFKKKYNKCHT